MLENHCEIKAADSLNHFVTEISLNERNTNVLHSLKASLNQNQLIQIKRFSDLNTDSLNEWLNKTNTHPARPGLSFIHLCVELILNVYVRSKDENSVTQIF